jgi:hypothetical protein
MHGLDNKNQCINVISLLLIPRYHAWTGQKNQWINVISLLLIPLYHAWAGQKTTVY